MNAKKLTETTFTIFGNESLKSLKFASAKDKIKNAEAERMNAFGSEIGSKLVQGFTIRVTSGPVKRRTCETLNLTTSKSLAFAK